MKDGTVIFEDPATGYKQRFYYDDATGDVTIKHCWNPKNTEQILEMNKAMQSGGPSAYRSITPGEVDMWKVATIPHVVIMKWFTEEGIEFWNPAHADAVKRKLNDPEYRYLRSGDFRV